MLELLIVIARARALAFRGHRELVLENLALRQQLTAVTRGTGREDRRHAHRWVRRSAESAQYSVVLLQVRLCSHLNLESALTGSSREPSPRLRGGCRVRPLPRARVPSDEPLRRL
jgi:hypothetical protein